MNPILSICIPTFNRGDLLYETLESIVPQLSNQVEVVISDNCSSDNTRAIVKKYISRFPSIRYFCADRNMGADWNYLRVVELALGKYCWLLGSDDLINKNSINKALELIQSGADVYVLGVLSCDYHMVPRFQEPILPFSCTESFDFADVVQRNKYFSNAISLAAYFSFISALIIDKRKWDSVDFDSDFMGTAWAHVMMIFGMLQNGGRVLVCTETMILKRGDNDSFLDQGQINRIRIDVDGYNQIADTFFGSESPEAFHIRRVLREQTGINHVFSQKIYATKLKLHDQLSLLDRIVKMLYSDPLLGNRVRYAAYLYTPFWIYRLVNLFYLPAKKILGRR